MLYQIHNGAVRFAADTILEHINFEIRDTEKIAVVGRNGCGKTTLLKLISGEVPLSKRDSDEDIYISKAGNPVIGYLKQIAFEDDSATLETEIRKAFAPILTLQAQMEQLLEKLNEPELTEEAAEQLAKKYASAEERFAWIGGYDYEREYDMVLTQFGFPASVREKRLSEFSGGQRTKIAFAKLLLSKPDILLLDEPTNYLDIATVEWLERYLKDYARAVVIVSHDRMFLDKLADVVYEIEYGTATRYPGNYSAFIERKRQNWEKQQKDYTQQQKEIERLTALIEKFKHHPTKVSMAWSKQKQLDHMVKIEPPARYDTRTFHANCTPRRETGKEVLQVNHLQIGYGHALSEVSFTMKKGQKLAVIGANGTGKSTLLKTITKQLPALGGSSSFGFQVDVGYFDQQIAQYSSEKTVLDDFWEEFPQMTQTEVRTLLGSFLFTQDDVFKRVSMLSGGEKGRLALAKILKRRPNFLILDEPTNHMDIIGRETLEQMLKGFSGSVLFVSHDRYFVSQIADSLLIFEEVTPDTAVSDTTASDTSAFDTSVKTGMLAAVRYYPYSYTQYQQDQNEKPRETDLKKGITAGTQQRGQEGQKNQVDTHFFHPGKESTFSQTNTPGFNPGKERSRLTKKLERIETQISVCEEALQAAKDELLNPEYASDYSKLSDIQKDITAKEQELDDLMYEWGTLTAQLEEFEEALKKNPYSEK